jgi:hypothetical protein
VQAGDPMNQDLDESETIYCSVILGRGRLVDAILKRRCENRARWIIAGNKFRCGAHALLKQYPNRKPIR